MERVRHFLLPEVALESYPGSFTRLLWGELEVDSNGQIRYFKTFQSLNLNLTFNCHLNGFLEFQN